MRDDWRPIACIAYLCFRRYPSPGSLRAGVVHAHRQVGAANSTEPHPVRGAVSITGSYPHPSVGAGPAEANSAGPSRTTRAGHPPTQTTRPTPGTRARQPTP